MQFRTFHVYLGCNNLKYAKLAGYCKDRIGLSRQYPTYHTLGSKGFYVFDLYTGYCLGYCEGTAEYVMTETEKRLDNNYSNILEQLLYAENSPKVKEFRDYLKRIGVDTQ